MVRSGPIGVVWSVVGRSDWVCPGLCWTGAIDLERYGKFWFGRVWNGSLWTDT